MAYFSNGTEGTSFEIAECEGCWFQERDESITGYSGCPIVGAHMAHNGTQCKDGQAPLREVLSMLIDQGRPLGQQCSMRLERADVKGQTDPGQRDLFEGGE
jgi:hypothetical protein